VVDAAHARYRAGQVSHTNLLKAQIRLADLRQQLGTAKARRASASRTLSAELDLPGDALATPRLTLDVKLPPRPARAEAVAAAKGAGPAVTQARIMALRATLMVQLAERQLQPNLSPGLSVERVAGTPPAAADVMYATGGPFLREMRDREQAAAAQLASALRRVPAAADAAWVTLDEALRRRRLNVGAQLARAQQSVDVAERGYRAGRATFFDLDSALEVFLRVSLEARAALRDAHVGAARLRVITGTGAASHDPLPAPPSRTVDEVQP
jgi:outer membrane protein TolC